jgi:hypothetical protein
MGCPIGGSSLFGPSDKYIKFLGGDLVAIEGAVTIDKQILNDLRISYNQLLRGRITLKAGQVNYLLNHLGLGDNATFVSISVRYNTNSKIEEDNYLKYNYYPNLSNSYYLKELLILTGNSTHRIPQLYLTNPNSTYSVTLDVLVANFDDTYNYFSDTINQYGLSFTGLRASDIETYVTNQSIVVYDLDRLPLGYINLSSIVSIERTGLMVTIQEETIGKIFMEFTDETESYTAYSMLNWIWNTPGAIVNQSNPYSDPNPPVVSFYIGVGGSASYPIELTGATVSGPYSTSQGLSFSATMSLSTWGGVNQTLTKPDLISLLISGCTDNRDGTMSLDGSNITVTNFNLVPVSSITSVGSYSVSFNIQDYIGNVVDTSTNFKLNITT